MVMRRFQGDLPIRSLASYKSITRLSEMKLTIATAHTSYYNQLENATYFITVFVLYTVPTTTPTPPPPKKVVISELE